MTATPRLLSTRPLRRLALFGGTFDPIHSGHVAVARAALKQFRLDAIHFIPAGRPPHKREHELAPYPHRVAMVALACAGVARFVPSLAEAGADFSGRKTFYSVDVVGRYRHEFRRYEKLYFILGADAFLDLPNWRKPEALLQSCDCIVVSRPGIDFEKVRRAIPAHLLSRGKSRQERAAPKCIVLRSTAVHLLEGVASPVSSTDIRRRVVHGRSIRGLVPAAVEDYIWKSALYR